jgi:HEPN domain-containing protein
MSSTSEHEHARQLLGKACEDLDALKGMLAASGAYSEAFSDGVFGFHAQQAAEKALKAWMAYKGVKYKHTHDLMSLIDSLDGSGEEVAALGELVDLNSFAVQYRYETADEDDEPINRREVLDKIQRLFERVEEIIK